LTGRHTTHPNRADGRLDTRDATQFLNPTGGVHLLVDESDAEDAAAILAEDHDANGDEQG
jgi:hypothetical protein